MDLVHGTGIELADMARGHQQPAPRLLATSSERRLQRILELVRKNRYH